MIEGDKRRFEEEMQSMEFEDQQLFQETLNWNVYPHESAMALLYAVEKRRELKSQGVEINYNTWLALLTRGMNFACQGELEIRKTPYTDLEKELIISSLKHDRFITEQARAREQEKIYLY